MLSAASAGSRRKSLHRVGRATPRYCIRGAMASAGRGVAGMPGAAAPGRRHRSDRRDRHQRALDEEARLGCPERRTPCIAMASPAAVRPPANLAGPARRDAVIERPPGVPAPAALRLSPTRRPEARALFPRGSGSTRQPTARSRDTGRGAWLGSCGIRGGRPRTVRGTRARGLSAAPAADRAHGASRFQPCQQQPQISIDAASSATWRMARMPQRLATKPQCARARRTPGDRQPERSPCKDLPSRRSGSAGTAMSRSPCTGSDDDPSGRALASAWLR